MSTAERHARALIQQHGKAKARKIARAKLDSNAMGRNFWIAVLEALRLIPHFEDDLT